MTQDVTTPDLENIVRQRVRGLRRAQGWTLDDLAERSAISPSTLSRIETGHRRIALDQLVPIAQALGISLDQLVEPVGDEDVVIRPTAERSAGLTTWMLSSTRTLNGLVVARMRITRGRPVDPRSLRVHAGREWFTVLVGTATLALGDRVVRVREGEAAEFSTMVPHAISAERGSVDILTVFDHEGRQAHLRSGQ